MVTSEQIRAVVNEALERHRGGSQRYGDLNVETDERDFLYEAEMELLDFINYAVYQVLKLRALRAKT